ncbi:MAG: hypothetical protein AB7G39_11820 [Alphaproteobacteria bacterium]
MAKGILGPAYEPVSAVAQALNPMDGIEALKRGGRAMLEGRPLDATIDTIIGAVGLIPGEAAVAKTSTALARSALRNAPEAVASKSAWIYNPPAKSPRPFEADYPAGARTDDAGRLTHDIDGNPLVAEHVAGRRLAGGLDETISPAELGPIAERSAGASITDVAPRALGSDAGRLVKTTDRRSGNSEYEILLRNNLSDAERPLVAAHEVAHLLDQLVGKLPAAGARTKIGMQLRQVYHDLNDGSWRRGMETPQRLQTRPEDGRYTDKEIPGELWAEAIRAYMADPNYLKTVAPDVAAAIRKAVNSNPSIRKIVQFNSGGIAGGVSLGTIGHDDRDR